MHFFLEKTNIAIFSWALLKAKTLAIGMQIAISTKNSTTEKINKKNQTVVVEAPIYKIVTPSESR
jgi:hypothetical protein